ncbi:TIGR01777 family oxidoreductase [Taibaiella chishuiensis]|uniref:TIGR01777 family protein n=1 Tax=Taibaiella chishuiensis TaxID=1434707 RepID=A0A2P8D0E9_9BACT|nr:TIGR01777 family oxidoreductase [Taibaiella chishuiensis]PSK90694.1 hypothetical protein B0I18_107104 [Taibaiella chishuiensis]
MQKILIAGGSGMVGARLNELLVQQGYETIILGRRLPEKQPKDTKTTYATWDVNRGTIDRDAIARADYIVNLAGAGVAEKRWTADRRREIIDSRVKSSALLVKALQETDNQVKAVVSASAAGYYGADRSIPPETGFREGDPPAGDFLGETCRLWENSISPVTELNKRLVIVRIGIVLSGTGGALAEFRKPLKFGLATILGSGRQIVSWVHIDDLCRLILYAIEQEELSGVYNAVAPAPVSNKTLTLQLARNRGGFYIPVRVPAFALKIAMGAMSAEVLKSATLSADKTLSTGFSFKYPDIDSALKQLLGR